MQGRHLDPRLPPRGAVIASQLEEIARGRTGDTLGTEAELMDLFGASRGSVREAIRMLEARGVVRMTRGRQGGLRVLPEGATRAIYLLSLHLEMQRVPLAEVYALRTALGELVVANAAQQLSPCQLDEVRQLAIGLGQNAKDLRRYGLLRRHLWSILSRSTGNGVLSSLLSAVDRVTLDMMPMHRLRYDRMEPQMAAIISQEYELFQAIIGHDPNVAVTRHREARLIEWEILETNIVAGRVPYFCAPSGSALNTRVLRSAVSTISDRILSGSYDENGNLGKIESIRSACGLSSAVMREAVRLMEDHGIIQVHTGRFGGVMVGDLAGSTMIERIAEALDISKHTGEAAACQEILVAEAAILAAQAQSRVDLTQDRFAPALADASGNATLAIMTRILDAGGRPSDMTLARLQSALAEGQTALARRFAIAAVREAQGEFSRDL